MWLPSLKFCCLDIFNDLTQIVKEGKAPAYRGNGGP